MNDAPAPADRGLPDPVVAQHPSGLRIVLRSMPDSPVASVHLWFDAGAADETSDNAGVAHFLEHLVFKGTAKRGVGEAAGAIEAAGGDLNAWTSWDETCFHATLEAGEVREALDVVFDMASSAQLDPVELDRERQVVLEEIRGYEDDPDAVVSDRLQQLLYGDHPYGRPVIGWPSTVEKLDRAAVEAFWRRHYHPGRALLSVAGPVALDEVVAAVDPLVRGWPVGGPRVAVPPIAAGSGHVERLDRDFGSVVVQLGWPGPAVGHPDLPALDVLMAALGQGAASRLALLLDLQGGLASHVWADASAWLGGGLVGVGFLCGETEEAVEVAVGELARVARNGLPTSLVTRARESILADVLFSTETTDGVAGDLAWNVARMGDPLADRRYVKALAAVTPAAVAEVAARWLRPDALRLVLVDKGLTTRKVRAAVKRAQTPPTPRPRPSAGIQVDVVHGVKIAALPERSEIASVTVLGAGAHLLLDEADAGLAEAWSRAVVRGAGHADATTFAERCDALALQLDAGAGRSAFTIDASFPVGAADESVELVGELLLDPHFAAEDCRNVREEMRDDRAALVDRPATVASERLWAQLWPGHPWRLPSLGTPRSLGKVGSRRLLEHHRAQVAADNIVVAVAGGVDPERVATVLAPYLEQLPRTARLRGRPAPRERGGDVEDRAGNEQATVLVGVRGVTLDHPDRTALMIASHALDSQSGRMFLELREQRGLAYGVWARSETGVDGGVFSAGLSTDPERVDEALTGVLRVLAELAEQGPSPAELAKVTRMIGGLSAMRLQRVAGRSHDLAWSTRFDLPYGLAALKERLAAVRPADVARVLRGVGVADPVRVVVRPRATRR